MPDLAVGPAQLYTTISSAIAAAVPGQSIYVQTGNYLESVTVNKAITIIGSGRGAVIGGALTIASGGDYSMVQNMRVMTSIVIDSGVVEAQILNFWNAAGQSVTDNGINSFLQGMQE